MTVSPNPVIETVENWIYSSANDPAPIAAIMEVCALARSVTEIDVIERCAQIAESEPELDGDPPAQFAHMADEMRATVRVTKREIAKRIRAIKVVRGVDHDG